MTNYDRYTLFINLLNFNIFLYFRKQYDISLNDHNQPLLIHRPKQPKTPEVGRKQPPEYICLIPELCYMTGLSEQLRNDINVKKVSKFGFVKLLFIEIRVNVYKTLWRSFSKIWIGYIVCFFGKSVCFMKNLSINRKHNLSI